MHSLILTQWRYSFLNVVIHSFIIYLTAADSGVKLFNLLYKSVVAAAYPATLGDSWVPQLIDGLGVTDGDNWPTVEL